MKTFRIRNCVAMGLMALALLGCGESGDKKAAQQTPAKKYVTNAEFVLDFLQSNPDSAGVVYHMRPEFSASCKHMFVEFGQLDDTEQWQTTLVHTPGKDAREDYGQSALGDQLQFFKIDRPGTHAVLAMGCTSHSDKTNGGRGVFTVFETTPGKLVYIGELMFKNVGGKFFAPEISDRTEFAQNLVRQRSPELAPYFQTGLMKRNEVKLSPEQQDAVSTLNKQMQKSKKLIDARNAIARKANKIRDELVTIKGVYGFIDSAPVDVQKEYRALALEQNYYKRQLLKFDQLRDAKCDPRFIEAYMDLYDSIPKKDRNMFLFSKRTSSSYDLNAKEHPKLTKLKSLNSSTEGPCRYGRRTRN